MSAYAVHDEYVDPYVRFCYGIAELCGLNLIQYRRGQMERRIRSFALRRGIDDLLEYLELLRREPEELSRFVDRLTINVSQLWRNPEQWDVLGDAILPQLAARGRIDAWSAGCSYGAEAYTLAAVCRTSAPTARASIVGWDIDPQVVERARRGWFSADDARSAPATALARWFDPADGGWLAKEELRSVCRFEVRDLLDARVKPGSFDLVLCRNTVIYFNEDVRDALHARLAESLRPGGYLLVGSTERVSNAASCGLVSERPFVYRKA